MVGKHQPGAMEVSPFIGYHYTARRHRESISERGLVAGRSLCQPDTWGVYVYNSEAHPSRDRLWWGNGGRGDTWRVGYVGPISPDPYVQNGWILHSSVPPEHISLMTPDD